MRRSIVITLITFSCGIATSQTSTSDEVLLSRARSLYDTPFTRDLLSFDCAVQFDWKQHFLEFSGSIPPGAAATVARLQQIQNRVSVDHTGAVVSAVNGKPNLTGIAHAEDLEGAYNAMVAAGLNAWLPSSTNVLLPIGPTNYRFVKLDTGYKLTMDGEGLMASLLLSDELRITSGVVEKPQPYRFDTEFKNGPNGFLLSSIHTSDTKSDENHVATFEYGYGLVDGFQLPNTITIKPATTEVWHYALTDCKAVRG